MNKVKKYVATSVAKNPPIVYIEWDDAGSGNASWTELGKETTNLILSNCRTSGFLLYQDDKITKVCHITWAGGNHVSGVMNIPTSCITVMSILKK